MSQLQRDIVVCDNAGKFFGNMKHLNGIFAFMRVSQSATPAFQIDSDKEMLDSFFLKEAPAYRMENRGFFQKPGMQSIPGIMKDYLMLP